MSEETYESEENGFIFSDEDFGRRYFPEQLSRRANEQAHANITRTHGGGNSFMRALRRRLAAAASNRTS
jgi:predicted alpha/beta superfamily hydrolase